jgi:EpsI family protein
LVLTVLVAQAIATSVLATWEKPPAPPDLAHFTTELPDWRTVREDPLPADVIAALDADQIVSRTYARTADGVSAGLFVAWFQSQRGGASQPHSPRVCLPAGGWLPESSGEVTIATSRGPITVNRLAITKGADRAIALYWYQSASRVTAGEWSAKFWTIADSITTRRTDTTLVRVVTYSQNRDDAAAFAAASAFASAVYPALRDRLP